MMGREYEDTEARAHEGAMCAGTQRPGGAGAQGWGCSSIPHSAFRTPHSGPGRLGEGRT
jgi:hypothetical protein